MVFGSSEITGVSSVMGAESGFFANIKDKSKDRTIKLTATILVVLVSISALEEPNAVWLAPPIKFMAFPPLPD